MTNTAEAARKRGVAVSEKMSPEQLRARLGQRGTKMNDRRTKRERTRSAQRSRAIREG